MATVELISCLRVSTRRQGAKGHGIAAQLVAVDGYLNSGRWRLPTECGGDGRIGCAPNSTPFEAVWKPGRPTPAVSGSPHSIKCRDQLTAL